MDMACFVVSKESLQDAVARGHAGSPVEGGAQAFTPRQGANERPDVHVY